MGFTNNCCSNNSSNALVISGSGKRYKTIVLDLNNFILNTPYFYIDEINNGNSWIYKVKREDDLILGSFTLDKKISSIVKAGFNGVMYAGPNIINGLFLNFTSVVNINELDVSLNKILYIEVEL